MKKKQKYNGRLKILKMCATTLLLSITGVYIDTSLMGWEIMDTLHQLRGLWHKSKIDHINGVKLKATVIGV